MKHRLRLIYRTPRAGGRCRLCGDAGHVLAFERATLNEYSFRCSCDAGASLPSWMPTWLPDQVRFRAVGPAEVPAVVRAVLAAGRDAGASPAARAAVGAPEPARHWQEVD